MTKPMLLEAKHAGYYDKEHWGDKYDKIQIITVEDLFEGDGEHPRVNDDDLQDREDWKR